ncbi:sigma 54-interacting transcriptional regulator, partial [Pseudomonas sp. TNT2022 ID1025]
VTVMIPVTRVGAQQPNPVDVRLVAASSIDLGEAVSAGKFHDRLYHYLREGQLELPALRERVGDILPLAEYFVGIYSPRLNLPVPLISETAQRVLELHSWPGNTRELENVIHFALLVSSGDEILPQHLNLATPLKALAGQLEQLLSLGEPGERRALQQLLEKTLLRLTQPPA